MALNPNKSVAILFGTPRRLKSLSGLKSVNVAGAVIPLSDKIKILGATIDANLTNFILRLYQVPAFTTFVLSGKFVHRWMIAWLPLLHLH